MVIFFTQNENYNSFGLPKLQVTITQGCLAFRQKVRHLSKLLEMKKDDSELIREPSYPVSSLEQNILACTLFSKSYAFLLERKTYLKSELREDCGFILGCNVHII
jgi:hypothetical protein